MLRTIGSLLSHPCKDIFVGGTMGETQIETGKNCSCQIERM